MAITTSIFYILIFIGIYIQVFFFLTFISGRKKLRSSSYAGISDEGLPEITFLIPCWNESQTIEGTITSVRALNYPTEKIRMIIIDDGSTDDTWNVLQQYSKDSNIMLLQKENGGKHDALNVALPYVATSYMCSIDADTFLEKNALRTSVNYMLSKPHLSSVGGTVLIHKPRTIAQAAQSIDYQMFSFSKKMLGMLGGVLVAPGAFSLYKTDDVREVGGYQVGHNLEDLELTYRLQTQGKKIDHCHDAVAYTTGPTSLRGLFKQRLRWSYGFLNNTYDYRHVVFNRKFGNFGLFTVPMGVLSYFVVVFMFLMSWFFIFRSLIENIAQVQIQGWSSLLPGLDFFFVNTQPQAILAILIYSFIILTLFLGRWISGIRARDYYRIPIFIIVYGALVPLWVLRSLTNFILSLKPAWR